MGWADAPLAESAAPAWAAAPLAPAPGEAALRTHLKQRPAQNFADYIRAGFGQSVTGLTASGGLPEVALTEDTPWYGRAAAAVSGIVGDIPAMVPGFMAGSAVGTAAGGAAGSAIPMLGNVAGAAAGGMMGGFAGANAAPAGIRQALIEMYKSGEATDSGTFLDKALRVAWETFKGGAVGAATGGAGVAARAVLPVAAGVAGKVGVGTAVTAAEVSTMATTAAVLEGHLPAARDFMDAAILIGGIKTSAVMAKKLMTVYERTGKTPAEVVVDAQRDPTIAADLTAAAAPRGTSAKTPIEATLDAVKAETDALAIPRAYEPLAAEQAVRAAVPDAMTNERHAMNIAAVLENPEGAITAEKVPNHINYRYVESPRDVQAIHARISEVFEKQIEEARGKESWDATKAKAEELLARAAKMDQAAIDALSPEQFKDLAAKSMAMEAMNRRAAYDIFDRMRAIEAATEADRPQAYRDAVAAIETSALMQAVAQGKSAEIARAQNAMKAAKQTGELVQKIQDLEAKYGNDPQRLAKMVLALENAEQINKFARDAAKATTWEKVVEAWKASILSGPVTHVANIMGNLTFLALRAPIETTASIMGVFRSGADRVTMMEPLARMVGAIQGSLDGLRLGYEIMRTGEQIGKDKAEQPRKAIEGTKGEIVRLPFRALGAEDAIFKTMNERGEAYAQGVRQASLEGFNPMTREFRQRVAEVVENPTKAQAEARQKAGERFTFNTELGEFGQTVQQLVRRGHLEFVIPFVRTPGNILKELTRLTPLAPVLKQWRDAVKKPGAERDKALAELAVGTGIMGVVVAAALNEMITGQGEPDKGRKNVQNASGKQPYSIKVGDTYYNYQRLQPLGTLLGIAADMAEVWDHMTEEESDKVPKMLAVAFANAVTNQTFLQGITSVSRAIAEPGRFGPKLVQNLAGSVVPNIVGQPTQMTDPVAREVNSILDAIRARIPTQRSELLPQIDIFGEPVKTKERFAGATPITQTKESTDKVRLEAERIGLSVSDPKKSIQMLRGAGKYGEVEMTPEERNLFATVSGKFAHKVLTEIVNDPSWDTLPVIAKEKVFKKVFERAHAYGASVAIAPDVREQVVKDIVENLEQATQPEEVTQ
tara:strand:- start:141 stop:3476 length:3336 start_codon:yes stop_codon:yes gene_type:complete